VCGGVAIVLATVNVFGGFGITHRMLRMFHKKTAGAQREKTATLKEKRP